MRSILVLVAALLPVGLVAQSGTECTACGSALAAPDIRRIDPRGQLDPGWEINTAGHLVREYLLPDFAAALAFANALGRVAAAQDHHPVLELGWGYCRVEVWTHESNSLGEPDLRFALASDAAFEALP